MAEYFSGLTDYWKDIYVSPVGREDFYHHEAVKRRMAAVLEFVDTFACGRRLHILDSGCGTGVFMEAMLERGHTVVGVDISDGMVAETRKTLRRFGDGKVAVSQGAVEHLEFPDRAFDLCLCIGVLQYLKDERLALNELSRVTRTGGHVIVSLPNATRATTLLDPYYFVARGPLFAIYKVFGKRKAGSPGAAGGFLSNARFENKRYYFGQLHGLFRQSGFSVSGVSPVGYGPLTLWRKEYLPRGLTLLISRRVGRVAMLKPLSFLKLVADRWVYDLKKIEKT